jgi:hypothetical protein
MVAPPDHQRRDDFVEPYFRRADPDQVVVILKAREPARILTAIGKGDRWHLEYARRWVNQYNFYLLDREWGRLFVRVCAYFPFSARGRTGGGTWMIADELAAVVGTAAAHELDSDLERIKDCLDQPPGNRTSLARIPPRWPGGR